MPNIPQIGRFWTSLPLSLPTAAAAVRQPLWKTLNAMRGRHPLVG